MRNADNSRFFDDFAKLASSAAGAFAGFRHHIEDEVRACATRFAREMDFVPRDEFEIVESMAKKAREENESLKKRMDALEKACGVTANVKKAAPVKAKAKVKTAKKAPTKTQTKKTSK